MLSELSDVSSSFAQHSLDAASPRVKSPTIDVQSMYPAEADELNTVMTSASTYKLVPSPSDDEAVQLSKETSERETEGVPVRMREIAPPFAALQELNDVAGVEEAIVKESPVEREAWMAPPDVVVHLTNENVHPVIVVLVCSFVSAEMLIKGDSSSNCVSVGGETETAESERLPDVMEKRESLILFVVSSEK